MLNNSLNFALAIPLINILATLLTQFFTDSLFNPGLLRAVLIISFFFYFFLTNIIINRWNSLVIFTLFYYFLIILYNSSNISDSLYIYVKFFLSSFMLIIGYHFSQYKKYINNIIYVLVLCLLAVNINFIISNVFSLGGTSYKGTESIYYFGATGVNITKHLTILLLCMPLIYYLLDGRSKLKKYLNISNIFSIIIILFAFKRSAILVLIVGIFSIAYYYRSYSKSIKYAAIFSIILIILLPLIKNTVIDIVQSREQSIYLNNLDNLEKQARYQEVNYVIDFIKNGDLLTKVFGKDLFNDTVLFNTRRGIHTDYMILLSGSGIAGLLIYLFMHVYILYRLNIQYRFNKTDFHSLCLGTGTALVLGSLILGFAGTVNAVEPRATIFLVLGILLRLISINEKDLKNIKT